MNKLTLLFGVLLCMVAVSARHFEERNDREISEGEEESLKKYKEQNPRHRRRRWQSNYGYDYPPPTYYYPERRDYERNNQELLQQVIRLLEDISTTLRRPPPPPPAPQPIYIPYPVSYQIPAAPCATPEVNITTPPRIGGDNGKEKMDPNRNWGLVVSSENDYDDGSDGSRPISFETIVPKTVMKRPSPKVEHGSVQGSLTTEAPNLKEERAPSSPSVSMPGMCNAAVLSCCGITQKGQQRQCFTNIGCSTTFANGNACNPQAIQKALELFRAAYSPVN